MCFAALRVAGRTPARARDVSMRARGLTEQFYELHSHLSIAKGQKICKTCIALCVSKKTSTKQSLLAVGTLHARQLGTPYLRSGHVYRYESQQEHQHATCQRQHDGHQMNDFFDRIAGLDCSVGGIGSGHEFP